MRKQLLTGVMMTFVLIVLLGAVYPLVVFGIGQVAFSDRADGSLVEDGNGAIVGSSLLAQGFVDADGAPVERYFQPRPSAAGSGYDAMASSASNLGPSNPDLHDAVAERAAEYRELNGLPDGAAVPVDAVTSSASGLDPHISVANARLQAPRVAQARNLPVDVVLAAVERHTQGRQWGFLGEVTVHVLELNLDLDRAR